MPPIIERGLLWSEKYIKTDMVYLARSGFWLLFGQGTTLLSVLALSIVFANFLPKETYGTYKYILSLTGIFSIFTLPGMTTALIRATARGPNPPGATCAARIVIGTQNATRSSGKRNSGFMMPMTVRVSFAKV